MPDPAPAPADQAYPAYEAALDAADSWDAADAACKHAIVMSLSEELNASVQLLPTSKEMWEHLESLFQDTSPFLLDLAAREDLELHSMDVEQAFLQGDLHEDIFMEIPQGFPQHGDKTKVWKLLKPLYGLKQAPREWHAKFRTILLNLGFTPSLADPILFIRLNSDSSWVLVYVDDLIIAAKSPHAITALKAELQTQLKLNDLGKFTHYLGMEITRDRQRRTITLTQRKYIQEALDTYGMAGAKSCSSPLPQHHTLSAPTTPSALPHPREESYRSIVGTLMYAMVCSRPDLAYPVNVLSRAMGPGRVTDDHWDAAQRCLRYLKHTQDQGLTLGGTKPAALEGFTDASWADDQADRRSTQGYGFSLGSGLISWRCTRSSSVALSSCEAELYGGTMAAQEALWLSYLLTELGYPPPIIPLHCDNKSTIALAMDPVFHARSKHIELRHFFLRDLIAQEKLKLLHVPSDRNLADLFTKAVDKSRHNMLCQLIGLG